MDKDYEVDCSKYVVEHLEVLQDGNIKHIRTTAQLMSDRVSGVMSLLVPNIMGHRYPYTGLDDRLKLLEQRKYYYKEIAMVILGTPDLDFEAFSDYIKTRSDLLPDERQMVLDGVVVELYTLTDQHSEIFDSEFRSKKFNIPVDEPGKTTTRDTILNFILRMLPVNIIYRKEK